MTLRAEIVLARLKQQGVEAVWVEPDIRIRGITYTVTEADAWSDGYRDGLKANRS